MNRVRRLRDISMPTSIYCLKNWSLIATIVAAAGALVFGALQYSINKQLIRMSRVVAITGVVQDVNNGELTLRNTGKLNLYLAGFRIGEEKDFKEWAFERRRLIAANTGGDPGYPIRPGKEVLDRLNIGQSVTLTLFLVDELDRKWVSELGFIKFPEKGDSFARICSFETFGESWSLKVPRNHSSDTKAEYVENAYFIHGVRRVY
ncbi:MAG: hypothetical protein ACYC2Y_05275 [Armatimonadota bacterium]